MKRWVYDKYAKFTNPGEMEQDISARIHAYRPAEVEDEFVARFKTCCAAGLRQTFKQLWDKVAITIIYFISSIIQI